MRNRSTVARADGRAFPPTRWSLVAAAREGSESSVHKALSEICQIYWYPLYAYARKVGNRPADAEDLTQEFLSRLVSRGYMNRADAEKGKLRSFLLVALKRFMTDDYRSRQTQKRGGGQCPVPIDQGWAEERYHHEPVDAVTPELTYDRNWALALLEDALDALRDEYAKVDNLSFYERMKDVLLGNLDGERYDDIATELEVTPGALKVAVFRMRQRFRQLLHRRIANTVASPDEVDLEITYLCSLFAR